MFSLSSKMKKIRAEGRNVSMIPFVGGLSGAAACWISPIDSIRPYFWVPIIADLGTGFYGAAVAVVLLVDVLSNRSGPDDKERNPTEAQPGLVGLRHAITGCILGTAVGDSIGLPVEGLSRNRQSKLFPDLNGHHFLFGRGMVSDDTEHTCMLAQALVTANSQPKLFLHDFAWRLRFWLVRLPAGVGRATLYAILKLWIGFPPRSSGVRSAGNGPAMRSALLGVCFGDDPDLLRQFVRAATRITHTHQDAEFGAMAVAIAAFCSSRGETTPTQYWNRLEPFIEDRGAAFATTIRNVTKSVESEETTAMFVRRIGCENAVTGYILHTVPAALHAWLRHPKDFRAAVREVVHCGGDTDTAAAITGAIVGSGVGLEGIPDEWLNGIVEWPCTVSWMKRLSAELARSVYEVKNGLPLSSADHSLIRVRGFAILFRNIVFLSIVLSHGVRRLLRPYR